MATKTTSRPDEPLQQRPREDAADVTPVGGPLVVTEDDPSNPDNNSRTATQSYHVPGTANVDASDEAAFDEVRDDDNIADTGISDREANRPNVAVTSSPEANYYTRDNIVFPSPNPGEVALAEAVAEAQLGSLQVSEPDDDSRFGGVEVDPTDKGRLAALSGVEVDDDLVNVTDKDREAAKEAVESVALAADQQP